MDVKVKAIIETHATFSITVPDDATMEQIYAKVCNVYDSVSYLDELPNITYLEDEDEVSLKVVRIGDEKVDGEGVGTFELEF